MNSDIFSSMGEGETWLYLLTLSHCKLRIAGALHGVLRCWHVAAQHLWNGKEKLKYFSL